MGISRSSSYASEETRKDEQQSLSRLNKTQEKREALWQQTKISASPQQHHRQKMSLQAWALPKLSKLLPLDEDSLKQVLDYTLTLSKQDGAEHLKNFLGDSPQAIEFISSFNNRRGGGGGPDTSSNTTQSATPPVQNANYARAGGSSNATAADLSEAPRSRPREKKKKAPLHSLPARRVEDSGDVVGGYRKGEEDDYYMPSRGGGSKQTPLANTLALSSTPDALQAPISTSRNPSPSANSQSQSSKLPPSASGPLISDLKASSSPSSRTQSPSKQQQQQQQGQKAKVTLQGGKPMQGASTALTDLEAAIRALELSTNPTKDTSAKSRKCTCNGTRHPLLSAAPNCLSCGKIVCVREGLGPCTFCGAALLKPEDVQAMIRALRDERGREKMNANNASQKKADVSASPRPFATPASSRPASGAATPTAHSSDNNNDASSLAAATRHRDKLLTFQAQNAQRTRVVDEAADWETPDAGVSRWASPAERAKVLKRQQRVLREVEWNARPEWEKRRVVMSLEVGRDGKGVRKMVEAERPEEEEDDDGGDQEDGEGDGEGEAASRPQEYIKSGTRGTDPNGNGNGGAFSRNPLLGSLIRPVWKGKGKGKGKEADNNPSVDGHDENEDEGTASGERRTKGWRVLQDDNDDNEAWILDGGVYGGRDAPAEERILGSEERAVAVGGS